VGHATEGPTALMTDGAESLLRLRKLIPVPTRLVLDYFLVAMKVRHADQCIGRVPPYQFSPNGSVFELYDRFNYLRGYLWSGRRDKFKESFDRFNPSFRSRCKRRVWRVVTFAILNAIT
jgi:hypothetical protein